MKICWTNSNGIFFLNAHKFSVYIWINIRSSLISCPPQRSETDVVRPTFYKILSRKVSVGSFHDKMSMRPGEPLMTILVMSTKDSGKEWGELIHEDLAVYFWKWQLHFWSEDCRIEKIWYIKHETPFGKISVLIIWASISVTIPSVFDITAEVSVCSFDFLVPCKMSNKFCVS